MPGISIGALSAGPCSGRWRLQPHSPPTPGRTWGGQRQEVGGRGRGVLLSGFSCRGALTARPPSLCAVTNRAHPRPPSVSLSSPLPGRRRPLPEAGPGFEDSLAPLPTPNSPPRHLSQPPSLASPAHVLGVQGRCLGGPFLLLLSSVCLCFSSRANSPPTPAQDPPATVVGEMEAAGEMCPRPHPQSRGARPRLERELQMELRDVTELILHEDDLRSRDKCPWKSTAQGDPRPTDNGKGPCEDRAETGGWPAAPALGEVGSVLPWSHRRARQPAHPGSRARASCGLVGSLRVGGCVSSPPGCGKGFGQSQESPTNLQAGLRPGTHTAHPRPEPPLR